MTRTLIITIVLLSAILTYKAVSARDEQQRHYQLFRPDWTKQ